MNLEIRLASVRVCLSIVLALLSANLRANSYSTDQITPAEWKALIADAQAFVSAEAAAHPRPFDPHPRKGTRNVAIFYHYFPQWFLSLDNKPTDQDFWSQPGKIVPAIPNPAADPQQYFGRMPISFNERPRTPPPYNSPYWRERNFAVDILRASRIEATGFMVDLPQINSGAMWEAALSLCQVASRLPVGIAIVPEPGTAALVAARTSPDQVAKALIEFSRCPAAYRRNGGLMVTPFGADLEPVSYWRDVLDKMSVAGVKATFVPVLLDPSPEHVTAFATISDEMTTWGWSTVSQVNGNAITVQRERLLSLAGKSHWIMPIRPQDVRPKSSSFWDSGNTQVYRATWERALQDPNVDGVQVITWNDFGEGSEVEPGSATNFLFYDLSGYYTSWILAGRQSPRITADRIYYSMRTQDLSHAYVPAGRDAQSSSQAAEARVGLMKMPWPNQGLHQDIEMLAFLSAPATLEVAIGDHRYRQDFASAGVVSYSVPLEPGVAHFAIYRSGAKVAELTAPFEIRALGPSDRVPNVFYFGGSDQD